MMDIQREEDTQEIKEIVKKKELKFKSLRKNKDGNFVGCTAEFIAKTTKRRKKNKEAKKAKKKNRKK